MKNTETKLNGVEIAKNKDEFVYLKDLQPGDAFRLEGDYAEGYGKLMVKIKGMFNGNLATVCLGSMQLAWLDPNYKIKTKDLIDYLEINTIRPSVNIPYIKWPDAPNPPTYPWYTMTDKGSYNWPKTTQPSEGPIVYCNSLRTNTADLDMQDHIGLRG